LFLIIAVLSIFALQTMQKKESEND